MSATAAFLAIKIVGVLALTGYSWLTGKDPHVLLSARWDALWYLRVVEHGYDFTMAADDGRVLSDMAFFPLFPATERLVATLLFLPPADAGLVVSGVAGMFAAAGIYATVSTFAAHRTALLTTVLWAASPVAIVQSMAYSESLFTAVAAWALHLTLHGRWISAGLLACAAGLTRPVGVAVTLAVWTGIWCEVRKAGRGPRQLVGLVLAPAGFAGYVLWVGCRTGSLLGYLDVQREWGNGFDAGFSFCLFVARLLGSSAFPAGLAVCVGVAALVWAHVAGLRHGHPLPVLVYTGVVVLLAMGTSGYVGSKPRLLVPAFGVLVPLAVVLLRGAPRVRGTVLVSLCTASACYGAVWLNGSGPP